jgi:hypothetical protein
MGGVARSDMSIGLLLLFTWWKVKIFPSGRDDWRVKRQQVQGANVMLSLTINEFYTAIRHKSDWTALGQA